MNEDYPVSFWIGIVVLLLLLVDVFIRWEKPWAKPSLLFYLTTGTWYYGDIINTTPFGIRLAFEERIFDTALWQVIGFLVSFRILVPHTAHFFTKDLSQNRKFPTIKQSELTSVFHLSCLFWGFLFIYGLSTAGWDILGIIVPPIRQDKVSMFDRGAVGHGVDFLHSAANYSYIFVSSLFGVFFVLGRGGSRWYSLLLIALIWPTVWFDRARNLMLAELMPAVLSYIFIYRSPILVKASVLLGVGFLVNIWFLTVLEHRDKEGSALNMLDFSDISEQHHLGLEMFEELCWINYLIEDGDYKINYGERYFAEFANVIPRTIWPDKPFIGIDYAIARGLGTGEQHNNNDTGVFATISTGMIGQGVCNFGPVFGVLASAFLMSIWIGILSRLWLQSDSVARLVLFMVGCGLTFNLGRDITLLVLWPFVFGFILVKGIETTQNRLTQKGS